MNRLGECIRLLGDEERWKPTTAEEQWENGFDFYEDQELGRQIRELEIHDRHLIRVDWSEKAPEWPDTQDHYCSLMIFDDDGAMYNLTVKLEKVREAT